MLLKEKQGTTFRDAEEACRRMIYFSDDTCLQARLASDAGQAVRRMLQLKRIIQAPFVGNRLVYVHSDLAPLFHGVYAPRHDFPNDPDSLAIYKIVVTEGPVRRSQLYEKMDWQESEKGKLQAKINLLRSGLKVYVMSLGSDSLIGTLPQLMGTDIQVHSGSESLKKLIAATMASLGPLTLRQLVAILDVPGPEIARGVATLREEQEAVRIRMGSITTDDLFAIGAEHTPLPEGTRLDKFNNPITIEEQTATDKPKEPTFVVLPSRDNMSLFWKSSPFGIRLPNDKYLVYKNGFPLATFNAQVKGQRLHVPSIYLAAGGREDENAVRTAIENFAQDRNLLPELPTSLAAGLQLTLSKFQSVLKERGFHLGPKGASKRLKMTKTAIRRSRKVTPASLIPVYFGKQRLTSDKRIDTKTSLLQFLHEVGLPPPGWSLTSRLGEFAIEDVQRAVDKFEVITVPIGLSSQALANAKDYSLYCSAFRDPDFELQHSDQVILDALERRPASAGRLAKQSGASPTGMVARIRRLRDAFQIYETNPIRVRWQAATWAPVPAEMKADCVPSEDALSEFLRRSLSYSLPASAVHLARAFGIPTNDMEDALRRLVSDGQTETTYLYSDSKRVQFTHKGFGVEIPLAVEAQRDRSSTSLCHLFHDDPFVVSSLKAFVAPFKNAKAIAVPQEGIFAEMVSSDRGPNTAIFCKRPEKTNAEVIVDMEIPSAGDLELAVQLALGTFLRNRQMLYGNEKFTVRLNAINGRKLSSSGMDSLKFMVRSMNIQTP